MKHWADIQALRDLIESATRAEDLVKPYQTFTATVEKYSTAVRSAVDDASKVRSLLDSYKAVSDLITGRNSLVLRDFIEQSARAQADTSRHAVRLGDGAIESILRGSGIDQFDAVLRDHSETFLGLTSAATHLQTAFDQFLGGVEASSKQLDVLAGTTAAAQLALSHHVVGSTSSLPEFEQFQRAAVRWQADIDAAEDENTRRKRLGEFLKQATDGLTGLDLSPDKRVKFAFKLIVLLIALLLRLQALQQAQISRAKDADLRRVQREHGQTLTVLAETVRQLQDRVTSPHAGDPIFQLSRRSTLREGPSGVAARVTTLPAGTRLRLITTVGRWHYVASVSQDRKGTVVTGWIYRRNVRPAR